MRHDLYTNPPRLQVDGQLWWRKFKDLPRTDDNNLGTQFTELSTMFGGQFVNMLWFPALYQVRCEYHAVMDDFEAEYKKSTFLPSIFSTRG